MIPIELKKIHCKLNCWLNIYKPRGISSAAIVGVIKKLLPNNKIGHAGTLDVEAEGVLPIAVGEATKLIQFLIESKKTYIFTVKFGMQTDSADASGKIIDTTNILPTKEQCINVCSRFIGKIKQKPNIFSAIKVNGVRSYKLARQGETPLLKYREVNIYDLELLKFDEVNCVATYIATCARGTYIRSLAEDISLALQSLGFVLELARTKVGIFAAEDSINIYEIGIEDKNAVFNALVKNNIRIEAILDDIPVINATKSQARQIKCGQKCFFHERPDMSLVWIRYQERLLAIGSIMENCFSSYRVFNIVK